MTPIRKYFSGVLLLASVAGMTLLSRNSSLNAVPMWGDMAAFMVLLGLAFLAYFFVIWDVKRRVMIPVAWILGVGLLCRLLLMPSAPIQENDPYRYVWDGQHVRQGFNPYLHAPHDVERTYRQEMLKHTRAEATHARISYPHIRTIYPPLAQALFAAGQVLDPWGLMGFKGLIFMAELASFGLILSILRKSGLSHTWLVLYAWSPLVIKEYANSLHVDAFAVLCLNLMIWLVLKARLRAAFLAVAGVTLIKAFGILLVPMLWVWTHKQNPRHAWQGLVLFGLACGLAYWPFLEAGKHLFEGLGMFAQFWRVNDGLYALIETLLAAIGLEGWARLAVAGCLLGTLAVTLRWLHSQDDLQAFFRASLIVVACAFFLAPTGNPWYYPWLLPFLVLVPRTSLIAFSGLVCLYYVDLFAYVHDISFSFNWVRWLEYGALALLLGIELWRKPLALSFRSLTKARLFTTHSHTS